MMFTRINMTLLKKISLVFIITSALFVTAVLIGTFSRVEASTPSEASDYLATSTAASTVYGAFTSGRSLTGLTKKSGSFGSVVITGANTGVVNIYDATTTDVTKRTNNRATSTILLASFPASTVAGTYTFDAVYTDGLFVELNSGTMPTSTITYR